MRMASETLARMIVAAMNQVEAIARMEELRSQFYACDDEDERERISRERDDISRALSMVCGI